ncbi:MAG: AMP-binding protein [Clostridia bacterium]|nr:AMP-binding protein [Clostridia bacterium]
MRGQKDYALNEVEKISSIHDMLYKAKTEAGSNIAFRFKKNDSEIVNVTYKGFYENVIALYAALKKLGLDAEHIACIGENSFTWIEAFLAGLISDGVFVPIDKDLPEDDIIHVLNHSDSEAVFFAPQYKELFLRRSADIPNVKTLISFGEKDEENGVLSISDLIDEGKVISKKDGFTLPAEGRDQNILKLLVYTSGTTGLAKGVMLSEHNLVSCIYYGLQVSTVYDTCLSVLPYHHTYEAVCGLLVSMHKHSTICINEDLMSVLKNLSLYHPSYIMLVPAFVEVFYNRIQKQIAAQGKEKKFQKGVKISNGLLKCKIDMRKKLFSDIHKAFGGRLRKIVCGGAPIRPEIGEFFDNIGIDLINGYGITECSPLVSVNRDYFNDPDTVGVKLPCVDIEIRDTADDGIGEICVKGDTVMLGYYKNEKETEKALIDGWFYTGDYGKFNEKGQLLITGRKKNLIVLNNGKNIYPEEIENYIMGIDEVTEVIVLGEKDESGEEKSLCAEIYMEDKIPEKELIKKIKEVLAPLPSYKHIHKVIIRDEEFPKTTSKKIKRKY